MVNLGLFVLFNCLLLESSAQYNQQYGNDQYQNQGSQYGNQQYGQQQRPGNPQYGDQQFGSTSNNNNGGESNYNSGGTSNSGGNQYFTPSQQFGGSDSGSDPNDDCCQEYCYAEDQTSNVNFATKTAYQVVFGKQSNQHNIPDCTPVQFWSINRHGTRFPSVRTIGRLRQLTKLHDAIVNNYEEKRSYPNRGRLCRADYDLIREWRWNDTIKEQMANALTDQGMTDMKFLARRYRSRFERIFAEPYSERVYSFQYTDTDRTHDSYQAYIEGLFRNNAFQVHANVFSNDKLIKPSKSCGLWQREVDDNPRTLEEYLNFKRRPEYLQMVRDVFRKLGFRFRTNGNDSIIEDMYDMCRYEKAWNLNQRSAWCVAFNKDQLKLLEYAEDLKYYYKGGYGNPLNARIGCPPVQDLYDKFSRTIEGTGDGNKVSVYFTHSITIQTFLTAMGIAKDDRPLTADSYYQHDRRKWRTSTIDPFASNLAAALYSCRSGEQYRVMFFLNEVPVQYPECSVGLCNWSTVKNKLAAVAAECNLDFCDGSGAADLKFSYVTYLIALVMMVGWLRH